HEIKFLRDDLQREHNRSFWLHVDAAWGGYVRTLFCGHDRRERRLRGKRPSRETRREWLDLIGVRDKLHVNANPSASQTWALHVGWNDPDVCAAYLAMVDADSTTVDPHKMGHAPYPAGLVALR